MLYELYDFIEDNFQDDNSVNYWYQGYCPITGLFHKLPRTKLAEAVARGLMRQLSTDKNFSREGKMYGILIVETSQGKKVLKAFSGLLNGKSEIEGWVSSISGRNSLQLEESRTLTLLAEIKQELLSLQNLSERSIYQHLSQQFSTQLQQLAATHQQNKQQRQLQRNLLQSTLSGEALTKALEQLNQQSQLEGIKRRHLKNQRDKTLQPLLVVIKEADDRIRQLKQRRKTLSHQLQQIMSANYSVTNFLGQSLSLQQLGALPTGTGECCAPKLLHYAATHNLTPVAMAEFWWGASNASDDKVQGQFYPACLARCQPIMGFLLSGLERQPTAIFQEKEPLPIVYEDNYLIAINKPEGILSVPGRSSDRYDSVISRLRHLLPDGHQLMAVHRLDRDTSGILLLARNLQIYNHLAQQFQQRKVQKIYYALVNGRVSQQQGTIKLPLWGNPKFRPLQQVDWQQGKESVTHFQVIAFHDNLTRLECVPVTGRTHQIRVHCAHQYGLGTPIVGDHLYGMAKSTRLYLHAHSLTFIHPITQKYLCLKAETPF